MATDIHVSGASIQRTVPHMLFQTAFVSGSHPGGSYHPYAVTASGQRFLIPHIDNLLAGLRGRGGPNLNPATVLASVSADRHPASSANSSVPIAVVLNWTSVLKK
jgi:hypothetical protein